MFVTAVSREDKGLSLTLCPVKVMEIRGFQVTAKVMAMIEHFLDYLPSLKKMEVYAEENDPTQLRNLRTLVLASSGYEVAEEQNHPPSFGLQFNFA
ncbi:hypothetical protein F2Q68_00017596 [Brassica cretica]|uniref:FBD domain-containing protein n=1 Tax=Brassica cretica TaxID=69181 RepID=A0A8S9HLV8_BRACR|nr:hypothetical protein F2Q68_00017596 [Brassica cretica]